MLGLQELRIPLANEKGMIARELHPLCIVEDVSDLKRRETALCGAKDVTGAADAKISLGNGKTVGRLREDV